MIGVRSYCQRQSVGASATIRHSGKPLLCRLRLGAIRVEQIWGAQHVLPDFQPGAAPALQQLSITLEEAVVALPPSWGSPGALPSLRILDVQVGSIIGQLPVEWAQGFLQMEALSITANLGCAQPNQAATPAGSEQGAAAVGAPVGHLPEEWAAGFPRLAALQLFGLGLAGPLPPSWQEGGLPGLYAL